MQICITDKKLVILMKTSYSDTNLCVANIFSAICQNYEDILLVNGSAKYYSKTLKKHEAVS